MNERDVPNLDDSGNDALDGLLAAARQGATPDELQHMESVLDRFTAVVVGGVRAADDDTSDPVPSPRSARTMFDTRIPRRAAAIVVATVLAAGTAAAAAGGVLPTPFTAADDPVLVDDTTLSDGTAVTDSTLDDVTDDTGVGEDDGPDDSTDDSTVDSVDDHSQSSRDYGNCQAWLNGAPKNPANPAFSHLADEAAEAGVTIDEYCTTVVDEHRGDSDPDDSDSDDGESDDSVPGNGNGSRPTSPGQGDDHGGGNSGSNGGGSNGGGSNGNGSGRGGSDRGDDDTSGG